MKLLYSFKHKNPSDNKLVELAIRKPTRFELDEIDLVYSQFLSDALSRGILTKEMFLRIYKDKGGTLSGKESKEYKSLLNSFLTANATISMLEGKTDEESIENKKKAEKERDSAFFEIQEIESDHERVFDRTADSHARNKTMIYVVFLLSQIKKGEEFVPVFEGEDFEERYESFSKLEESCEEDALALLNHFIVLVSRWYFGDKSFDEDSFKAYDSISEFFVYEELENEEQPSLI